MTGTSPFTFQSPSYHSSSYLPKLEAEFCRDFSCCGVPLPSLHDLLRHYEEHHAQQMPLMHNNLTENQNTSNDANRQQPQQHRPQQQNSNNGITSPISGMGGIQLGMMRQQQMQRMKQGQQGFDGSNLDMRIEENEIDGYQPDGEVTGDMEMEEDEMTPPPNQKHQTPHTPRHQPSQQPFSHPPTPSTMHHPSYQNTPNMAHAQPSNYQQPTHFSPDSSVPGTPLAMDQLDYSFNMNGMQGLSNIQSGGFNANLYGNLDVPGGDMSQQCIDEPAKRLFNPGGHAMGGYTQAQLHQLMMGSGGVGGAGGSSELARRLREEGATRQAAGAQGPIIQQEDKPFKCPVIGCEKAYKNQNGLKYHKSHGHTNQQLHENSDGTFSIVNPETSIPYPGNLGMEKQKPYRCEYCGKRYKNLNGLKYHRAHSTHTHGGTTSAAGPQPVAGGVVAVAGGVAGENGVGMV